MIALLLGTPALIGAGPDRDGLLRAAGRGDAGAMVSLGALADLDAGDPSEPQAALGWYRRAAEAGSAAGALDAAVMLDNGRGVARDVTEAARWYALAAVRGEARAAYDLALLYLDGDGVPRNDEAARAWLTLAAASLPAARTRLRTLPGRHPEVSGTPRPELAIVGPGGQDRQVTLVWTAPAGGGDRYAVTIWSLDGDAPAPVAEAATSVTAAVLKLPAPGRAFAWRVYAVEAGGRAEDRQYVPSAWQRFEAGALPGR